MRRTNGHHPSDRLKIGLYAFFPGGGIGRYTYELLRALGRREDVEAELICSPGFMWKHAPEFSTWDGLYPVWTPKRHLRRAWFLRGQVANPILALKHAHLRSLNVLHLANINHLTFPLWRRWLDGSRIFLSITAHDVQRRKAMFSRRYEDAQLKAVYRRADAIFVHSEFQMDELVAFAGVDRSRIHIVPHGPYPHGEPTLESSEVRKRLGIPADKQVALFFGQIRDEKNLEGFLRGLALLSERPHLLVAGKAWPGHKNVSYYEKLVDELGLGTSVTFRSGFIAEEEVPNLFGASDWVILPYHSTFTSQSGVLNVAAAYNRPVLVSRAPVLRESVEKHKIGVVSAGDTPEDLARAIERMIQNTEAGTVFPFEEYRRLHSWDENARLTVEAYRSMVRVDTDRRDRTPHHLKSRMEIGE